MPDDIMVIFKHDIVRNSCQRQADILQGFPCSTSLTKSMPPAARHWSTDCKPPKMIAVSHLLLTVAQ